MRIRLFSVGAVAWLALTTTATAQGGSSGSCDRACLLGIADACFAALVAHDPSKAPMAPNAKFTEQAQILKVGEGLWKTTTEGPTIFKIPVPDPESGQIGVIAMIKANVPTPPARAGRTATTAATVCGSARAATDGVYAVAVFEKWLESVSQIRGS